MNDIIKQKLQNAGYSEEETDNILGGEINVAEKDVDELKELLMLGSSSSKSYSEFKVFNRNILSKSISEINDITDIYIEYTTIKHIRSVVAIEFKIRKKANNEQMITFSKLEKILDNK